MGTNYGNNWRKINECHFFKNININMTTQKLYKIITLTSIQQN